MSELIRQKSSYIFWRIVAIIGSVGIVMLFTIIYLSVRDGADISKQNQGYIRYIACVAQIRNEKQVIAVDKSVSEYCWINAEKSLNVKLPRYSTKGVDDGN